MQGVHLRPRSFKESWIIKPVSFVWEYRISYETNRITEVRPAASLKAAGASILYKIFVQYRQIYMNLRENRNLVGFFVFYIVCWETPLIDEITQS